MRGKEHALVIISLAFLFLPLFSYGQIIISEIMYDLEGSDTDREWVEIQNTGGTDIDLTGWKFDDGADSKHGLNVPPKNGGQGDMILHPGQFAILADSATVFMSDHPGFTGTVIDTLVNLGQVDDRTYAVKIFNPEGAEISSSSYTNKGGGNGDGNSLQFSGGQLVAAYPTAGALNAAFSSSLNQDTGIQQNTASSTSQNQSTSSGIGSNRPVEPQIFASIEGSDFVVVGVESIFKGYTVGLDKKPITNARYLWSFGDGTSQNAPVVSHVWYQPGTYIVIVESSSGEWNASARKTVKVFESKISISRVQNGLDGFITLTNPLAMEVDLSGWVLRRGGKDFRLAKSTIILPNSELPISNKVTMLLEESTEVFLLYPGGNVAASYAPGNLFENKVQNNAAPTQEVEIKSKETVTNRAKDAISIPSASAKLTNAANMGEGYQNSSSTILYSAAVVKSSAQKDWFLALMGVVGVGLFGVLFSLRYKKVSEGGEMPPPKSDNTSKALSAEDFEIIELKNDGKKA